MDKKETEEKKYRLERLDSEELKKIGYLAGQAYIRQSDAYKQKLVYTLLNSIKTEDKDEFMSTLLRSVNAKKGDVSPFMEELEKIHDNLRTKEFSDIAHAIIIGIMSTYEREIETKEE
jgi:hypothetical protein